MTTIQFQFAHIEQALADMHSVAHEKRSAFQGRLKHYQKQGFPSGINTGRGKAAVYYVSHAVQLAIALEMNQVGLNPERAIRLCMEYAGRIQASVYHAATRILSDDEEAVLLVFDPVVLSDLRSAEGWDETAATFDTISANEFRASIDNSLNIRSRRYAVINVSVVIADLSRLLSAQVKYDSGAIMGAIRISSDKDNWRDGNP